jgi:hypothetical protein
LSLESVYLFDCVSFFLLVEFCAFTVASDALALLAAAAFVAVEGALVEQFGHLVRVEVGEDGFISGEQGGLEEALFEHDVL